MIVDYFPSGKVLGGQVVKLATSHRNLHETWKRWCPSSPSFQVQLEKIVRSMMRSDHSCALCASCILFGKLSHITGVPTENHWVVDLPPQKKNVQFDDMFISFGDNTSPMLICGPPPNFLGDDQKDPTVLVTFFFPATNLLFEPTQLHFRPALKGFWVTAPWFCLIFWAIEHGSWGGGVCVFCFSVAPRKSRPLGNLVHHP